jgi:hypothetical protein
VTAAEVAIPRARLVVALAAVAVCAAILWLGRGYTFYFDEWTFIISAPDWTAVAYLLPHNGHPAMLPRLIYAGLLGTVGLRAYWPYMVVLLALHATNVVLLFELVRRRAGDLVGLACAAPLLVLGAAWENLLWAFQLSLVGSVACGLGALLALESAPRWWRMPVIGALLAGSLMFSGVGLVFAVAVAVGLLATRGQRNQLAWLVPVAIVFGAWYVAFGRSGGGTSPAFSATNILLLPLYTLWGMGTSVAGLVGAGGWLGIPFLVLAAGVVGFAWWRGGLDPLALGVAAGLVAFYVLTGLSRAQLGYEQAGSGRYIYEGAVFWLILLADAARWLPWRGTWRPAVIACLFLACFNSSVVLFTYATAKTAQMQRQVADLQALAAERGDPCLNPNGAVDLLVMPQVNAPALYYRAIDRYGDPVASEAVVDLADFDQARTNLQRAPCN